MFTNLGPSSTVPLDRAQNLFRYAGRLRNVRGRHSLSAGFEILRRQTNGTETSSHRGFIDFRNDFGRDAVINFLLERQEDSREPSGTRTAVSETRLCSSTSGTNGASTRT